MNAAPSRSFEPFWSIDQFRVWVDSRPEEERWEMIDGRLYMQAPPTGHHQSLNLNLCNILNDGLESISSELIALVGVGLDLRRQTDRYQPEPDAVVVDGDFPIGRRYFDRFHLAAEIVSLSDGDRDRDRDLAMIDLKRIAYRAHPHCRAILVVEQERIEVRVEMRGEDGAWAERVLIGPDDRLVLPAFGVDRPLRDLYRRTPLLPR